VKELWGLGPKGSTATRPARWPPARRPACREARFDLLGLTVL
jgi:hypothetical protein